MTTRLVIGAVAVLVLGGLVVLVFPAWRGYRFMHSMLMEAGPPSALLTQPDKLGIAGMRSVDIAAPGGVKLAAWYVPPTQGASIILTHGVWSDRSVLLAELRLLAGAGFGVVAFDWPGLGRSTGSIRWDGQARDALRGVIDWLSVQPGVDPARIGGLGFSIGGYMMTQVAARDPRLRAVVLESPSPDFGRYVEFHTRRWGAPGNWGGRLALRDSGLLEADDQPLKLIGRIAPRAVLLIGGTRDTVVPTEMMDWLYEAAAEPKEKWIVDGASHGDYATVSPADYPRRLTEFFTKHLP
jgi:dipeptidyl aminopeptidase/acylaminoacyl peptidase